MKYLRFIVIVFFSFFPLILSSQTSEDKIKAILDTLGASLKNKDVELAQHCFAPNFSISTSTWPSARNQLNVILENLNFREVTFVSKEEQIAEETTLVHVKFLLLDRQTQKSIIAFSPDNKIVFIDYFDRLFGQSRYNKSNLAGILPFQQNKDESIILKIKLNNSESPLSFLLDTGADGMAIRKTLADSLNLRISHTQNANIVGGQAQVSISSGNTVHLSDSLSLTNQNIAIFETIRDVDGIIGLNLVKHYITRIDFDRKEIHLYTFGEHQYLKGETISISTPYNLILIPGSLNLTEKKTVNGNFLFDTGANYHLIAFARFVRKNRLLLSGFKPEAEGSTISMGHATPVFHGKAYEFSICENIVQNNMPVTLQASGAGDSSKSGENTPDGSIGIKFFSSYNLTIDLLRKEMHLSSRNSPL
ncbi:hypothetical protein EZS27_004879 [termite gut metagenome]|uniref:Peptidase A2 domain-containing protein n=1 Tax=termite gut metagenome TaxID=433724 RepID=A0A5J4SND0_9ZZZZ